MGRWIGGDGKPLALVCRAALAWAVMAASGPLARAEGDWETTPESEAALERGLAWLARTQGPQGNWGSNDLGLVSMGALAFLAAGHMPGRGPYGDTVERAMDYVLRNAKPSGLLNIASPRRDMYNHGLSTFVLGQAYGTIDDPRIKPVLDRALKLIADTQCEDGGWDYEAKRLPAGHDLSLAVMQAMALRSAMDSGLEVPPEVIEAAIRSVREYYAPNPVPAGAAGDAKGKPSGGFSYKKGSVSHRSEAMVAAGVVCLQEFGQYDDWRIEPNMHQIRSTMRLFARRPFPGPGQKPDFNGYALYYTSQALYQVGGEAWKECYPTLRDSLVSCQVRDPKDPQRDGQWIAAYHVSGRPGELYMTSAACFTLAIPNRYLPILQEGRIEGLHGRFGRRGE